MSQQAIISAKKAGTSGATIYKILFIIGICHLLNDALQAVVPAMFPILEKSMGLSYTQLGVIAFSLNMVTDRKPNHSLCRLVSLRN
jgi:FSR family fosmidomycin resistance protein-like MFS transporter